MEKNQTTFINRDEFNKINLITLSIIKNDKCPYNLNGFYQDSVKNLIKNNKVYSLKDFNELLIELNKKINLNIIYEDNDYFFNNCEQVRKRNT